jgi:ribosomal protein L12E/L44/L45/RPP1/RPP2
MLRIVGVFVFMLALLCLTLPAQPVQAAAANPELSKSYQSAEEEKKEEDEDEEPDCE